MLKVEPIRSVSNYCGCHKLKPTLDLMNCVTQTDVHCTSMPLCFECFRGLSSYTRLGVIRHLLLSVAALSIGFFHPRKENLRIIIRQIVIFELSKTPLQWNLGKDGNNYHAVEFTLIL